MGVISQPQFDILDGCTCIGDDVVFNSTSIPSDNNGYFIDKDIFTSGTGDKCETEGGSNVIESSCKYGNIITDPALSCPLGLCSNGACVSCKNVINNANLSVIQYYSKIISDLFQNPKYEKKEIPIAECKDNKTLIKRTCDNAVFSQPVVPDAKTTCASIGKDVCKTVNGLDQCVSCPDQTCKLDKIGTTRCGSDPGSTVYQKCEDPDGDGCGSWNTGACGAETFCMPGKTSCGNYCDPTKETDGGLNYGKYGSVFNYNNHTKDSQYSNYAKQEYKDSCSSNNIREYYCENGAVKLHSADCTSSFGQPCLNGACGYTCDPLKETDGGANFETKGYVVYSSSSTTHFDDTCIDGNTLKETVCNADKRLEYQTHACGTGNSCVNGACGKSGLACGTTTCVSGDICVSSKCVTPYKCYDTNDGTNEKYKAGLLYYYDSDGKIINQVGSSPYPNVDRSYLSSGYKVDERYCTGGKVDPNNLSSWIGNRTYSCNLVFSDTIVEFPSIYGGCCEWASGVCLR